jgi:hypothetical protein
LRGQDLDPYRDCPNQLLVCGINEKSKQPPRLAKPINVIEKQGDTAQKIWNFFLARNRRIRRNCRIGSANDSPARKKIG